VKVRRPPRRAPTLRRRILLLLASVLAGALVGAIGRWGFESAAWFLAVPGFVAVAWLFVADPTECSPGEKRD
jgi:hypothetical protein